MFEPFHFAVAIGPIAIYLLLLGCVRMSGRPLVTSGGRDLATLAFALVGLCMIGPAELFFPRHFASLLGPRVWLFILVFYSLCVTLVILMSRPRLIVYGLTSAELVERLRELLPQLDTDCQWLAESVVLPNLGIHAIVESASSQHVSQIVAATNRQSIPGWAQLEAALTKQLRGVRVDQRSTSYVLAFLGLVLLVGAAVAVLLDPQSTVQAMNEMLRR